ncbi:MAG: GGDEF domain-containing protein [Aliihoeflea sp.]
MDRVVERAAFAYAGFAIGMSLQYFEPFGFALSRFLSNAIFLASMVVLSTALMARHGRRAPLVAMSAIVVVALTALAWGLIGEPNLTLRVAAASLGFAAVSGLLAYKLWRISGPTLVDRILLGAAVFITAGSVIRPAVIYLLQGGLGTEQLFFQSLYWLSLVLSAVFFLSIIALTLISSASLDTIETLRTEAGTDMLSGALNRRGFEQGAIRLIRKAECHGQPVSLVLADLDHFKQVNDHFGHACGDAAIRKFAECLVEQAGADVLVGRLGGEEFAILASGVAAPAARLMAEGMRMGLSLYALDGMPADRRLTASFGVAQLTPSETLASLIERADQALYAAKAAGRDRVRVSALPEEAREGEEALEPARAGQGH